MLNNRRVIVVDGTGISMPDTLQSQAVWPQTASQRPGCGFPTARICACFSLESGALLSYAIGNKKSHELPLFRQQWKIFRQGDIFLGDKGFCSYFDIANLKKQGVDSVVTLARRTPVNDANCIKKLGPDDLLISWKRPVHSANLSYSLMYEAAEEADIEVRVVSFKGSLQALRNWEPHLNQAKVSNSERFRLISDLYDAMTNTPLRQRPGRSEPRCLKRRPKNYQRLTAPRHEMKEIPHRNRYRAENS